MTQRYIDVPPDKEILVGWDRPLQHYFLTVFKKDAADDEEDVIWSSLDDPHATRGGGLPWPAILDRFHRFAGQPMPEPVRALLRMDRIEATTSERGNIISRHRLDGAPVPP
jgi:hypothetical protein